ncbi:MAG: NYN domain-containing protein [Candidatus Omnitrophica bacterium]|nr:NYN domain-containing protein [Candidatus Omnitrophota bacterium]
MSLQYVIDGYNIINHPLFPHSNKQNQNSQSLLLSTIIKRRLCGSLKNKVIIVFDGYPAPVTSDYENIMVVFSRKIDADEKIKKIIEESGVRRNMIVVTNDKEVSFVIKSLGAKSMCVEDFLGKNRQEAMDSKEASSYELNYSQKHYITEELKKLWLKEK